MLSPWAALESQMQIDIGEHFGECFTYRPMRRLPNRNPIPDPTREAYELVGVWMEKAHKSDMDKDGVISRRSNMHFITHTDQLIYVEVGYCELEYDPQQGDQLIRNHNGLTYEIGDIQPNGQGSVELYLTSKDAPHGRITT